MLGVLRCMIAITTRSKSDVQQTTISIKDKGANDLTILLNQNGICICIILRWPYNSHIRLTSSNLYIIGIFYLIG